MLASAGLFVQVSMALIFYVTMNGATAFELILSSLNDTRDGCLLRDLQQHMSELTDLS